MTETIAIIDYGSGNLRSAAKAFERKAADVGAGQQIVVTADATVVKDASRVVLPGVGAFGDCKRGLEAVPGMVDALIGAVCDRKVPFLGICVGMQLMADRGLEYGSHDGFGWIGGDVTSITPSDPDLKIPHMGWNDLHLTPAGEAHPVMAGLTHGEHAYFVHSFALDVADESDLLATVDYAGAVTAVVGRGNMVGTQFHPEKSQKTGLQLIENFLKWDITGATA